MVLDVQTGEIMALASFPTFNPNNPGAAPAPARTADGREIPGPFFNRVTTAAYELGSTFKPITMAAAIDSGTVTSMARRFDATAPMQIDGFKIHDHDGQNRWLDIPETLIHSSNIATARIADEMGGEKLARDVPPDGLRPADAVRTARARPHAVPAEVQPRRRR